MLHAPSVFTARKSVIGHVMDGVVRSKYSSSPVGEQNWALQTEDRTASLVLMRVESVL
jgi:hypothetical protein